MIVALAGGVGGAKLVDGLARVVPADALLAVVNTGDDFVHLGLHVSPDLDTVMYTLAGQANPQTGWGLAGETWQFMKALGTLGGPTWFRLGDQDLATHVRRTQLLASGATLSHVTTQLCRAMGVAHRMVPVSDDAVRTVVDTDEGELNFQDYFVRRQCQPRLLALRFDGASQAQLAPAVAAALDDARLRTIIVCPSNPYLSIDPMLAVPGLRERLHLTNAKVVAISPIVGGRALKGPAAKIMDELGRDVSALEVARHYGDLIDGFVLDNADAALARSVAALGIEPLVTSTVMTDDAQRAQLAREVIAFASGLAR